MRKRQKNKEQMKIYLKLQTKKLEMEEAVKRRKLDMKEAGQAKKLTIEATNANTKEKKGDASTHDCGLGKHIPKDKKLVREAAKGDVRHELERSLSRTMILFFCTLTCVPVLDFVACVNPWGFIILKSGKRAGLWLCCRL